MRTKAKKLLLGCATLLLLLAFLGTGCTKYASQQDLQMLEDQKQAALSAEKKTTDLEKDKADLERQLSKQQAKLNEAEAEKAKVTERQAKRQAEQTMEGGEDE